MLRVYIKGYGVVLENTHTSLKISMTFHVTKKEHRICIKKNDNYVS
jgi:hypothetical protein